MTPTEGQKNQKKQKQMRRDKKKKQKQKQNQYLVMVFMFDQTSLHLTSNSMILCELLKILASFYGFCGI